LKIENGKWKIVAAFSERQSNRLQNRFDHRQRQYFSV